MMRNWLIVSAVPPDFETTLKRVFPNSIRRSSAREGRSDPGCRRHRAADRTRVPRRRARSRRGRAARSCSAVVPSAEPPIPRTTMFENDCPPASANCWISSITCPRRAGRRSRACRRVRRVLDVRLDLPEPRGKLTETTRGRSRVRRPPAGREHVVVVELDGHRRPVVFRSTGSSTRARRTRLRCPSGAARPAPRERPDD